MGLGTKSAVLNHWLTSAAWPRPLGSLVWLILATVMLARSAPMAENELSSSEKTVKGKPDCQLVMKLRLQPLMAALAMPLTWSFGKA